MRLRLRGQEECRAKSPGQGVVLPITDPSLSQLQSLLQGDLTSSQTSGRSLGDKFSLCLAPDFSLSLPTMRLLEQFQCLGFCCFSDLIAKERGSQESLLDIFSPDRALSGDQDKVYLYQWFSVSLML